MRSLKAKSLINIMEKELTKEDIYSEEIIRIQKAGVLMQGFFVLGFLFFIYVAYIKQYVESWTQFISIFFMTMVFVCILYTLKKPIGKKPVKKSLVIQVKENKS